MSCEEPNRHATPKYMALRFITCRQGILVTIVVLLLPCNAAIPPPAVIHHGRDESDPGRYEYTGRYGILEPCEGYIAGFYCIWPVIETHLGPGTPNGLWLKQGIFYRLHQESPGPTDREGM